MTEQDYNEITDLNSIRTARKALGLIESDSNDFVDGDKLKGMFETLFAWEMGIAGNLASKITEQKTKK